MNKLMEKIQAVRHFFVDVVEELKKSSWPTRGELMELTMVVIFSMFLFAVFVGISDFVLRRVINLIVR